MSDIFDPYSDPYADPGGQQNPGYDPYALDPETAMLITQLAQGGYNTGGMPQMLNVPYTKELLGVGTDPLRNVGGAQTRIKSAASIMGYNPIQEYAGPKFDPYVPQYDAVAQEATGDQYAEALLQDLQNGQGALALANQIDQATYDPKTDGGPVDGKPLSPAQAANYKTWLDRAQKAYTADSIELGKRDQQASEGDVNSYVPTPEAQNFNEDDWIRQIAQSGALGQQRQQHEQYLSAHPNVGGPLGGNAATAASSPRTPPSKPGQKRPLPQPQGNSVQRLFQSAEQGGYKQREMGYRDQARREQAGSVRPSPARERAVRAVMAYRLAMGLKAT